MKTAIFAVLFLAAPCGAKEKKVKQTPSEIESLASFTLPPGWEVEKGAGPDPSLRASRGRHLLRVRLFGGPKSRYDAPAKYLTGLESTTMGRPPERDGSAKVAGGELPVYRHGYPIELGDPHLVSPDSPKLATERFVLVPAGKRFFVLSYAFESSIPDPSGDGTKAWEAFLKGFAPRR